MNMTQRYYRYIYKDTFKCLRRILIDTKIHNFYKNRVSETKEFRKFELQNVFILISLTALSSFFDMFIIEREQEVTSINEYPNSSV